jgi:signal transduction histidine kinase
MEDLLQQQRRFTADASHELRTPLTTVKASASLALSEEQDLEGCRRSLRAIYDAANTMNKMVVDLLLLARSDEGQLGLNKRTTSLKEIIARAAEVVNPTEHAPLHVDVPADLKVVGNEDELARLFSNLLENAARHTSPEGGIFVSARVSNGHVVVSVTDTGEGIPLEHLPHVCERFYRVDSARTHSANGGTGLGLAICKSIVDAHGGEMKISSEVGKGTTLDVTLATATG